MSKFWTIGLLLWVGLGADVVAAPRTRAERTDYRETSTYADVLEFLKAVEGPVVSLRMIGKSAGGRPMPLAIVARGGVTTPEAARKAGKLVVYVQANIHGGEVEGKESAQMLVRDLAEKPDDPLLDKLVLLVAPIYNIDGNESLGDGPKVRPSQDGPARIGARPNGVGLDLNRDAMKAEAPETRAVLEHVYKTWNPEVVLDLHTTNGTRHGYALTYSPPLSPDTDAEVLKFARDELLPTVRKRLATQAGLRLFDYGNVETRGGVPGWYTFADEGRYVTNYVGLRNRIGVLSEAASFLPFQARVEATSAFVREVLNHVAARAEHVRAITKGADSRFPDTVGVRFATGSRGEEPVPLEVVAPGEVVNHLKAPTKLADRVLPIHDRFRVTRTTRRPAAYLIPASEKGVVALLRSHGATVSRLDADWRGPAEVFEVQEIVSPPNRFQTRPMYRLEGAFADREETAKAGTFVVRTAQPLGTLVALLLEPESLDGVAAWGLLDHRPAVGQAYPIWKTRGLFEAQTIAVP